MDLNRVHGSIMREHREPGEGHEGIPVWLAGLFMGLVFWGGFYLAMYSGGFRADVFSAVKAKFAGPPDPATLGQRTFAANCLVCHQAGGRGVPRIYPPLAGSEVVLGRGGWREDQLIAMVLAGLQGPVTVGGQVYNGAMPAWRHLSDDEIAAVLTYVRGSWGNAAPPVPAETVRAVRERTKARAAAWTHGDLRALPAN